MKRSLLIVFLVVSISFVAGQQGEYWTEPPQVSQFPPVPSSCVNKQKLYISAVAGVPVGDVKGSATVSCQFHTVGCQGKVTWYKSTPPREGGLNICADWEAARKALAEAGIESCCDREPECKNYSGEITCDCNGDGMDETTKSFQTCSFPANWPSTFKSRCEDWINSDGTLAYGTDIRLMRQGQEYLKTLKCPALNCHKAYESCTAGSQGRYEKCLTTANILGWRERCLRNHNAANRTCTTNRQKCLDGLRKFGPAPRPQPLPTPSNGNVPSVELLEVLTSLPRCVYAPIS